ncbi:MAG TPA: phosphohydrolase, partial [Burkholderiales bacterium]|nr:phosphohydrolase [Burkholderiales bacterium]
MSKRRTVTDSLSMEQSRQVLDSMEDLTAIGVALSKEKDINRLLEAIVDAAKHITHADGGTLYRKRDDDTLSFEILRTDSLDLKMGGTTNTPIPFYPIQLYRPEDGAPNNSMVASYCALTGETVN